jgi:peptidoglycan/LPS O-acetylase OafA/YrhL
LAYLAKCFNNQSVNRLAKIALIVIGLIIVISSFQEIWLRNFLAWFVAIALLLWGNKSYPSADSKMLEAIAWGSQRSYCAFLIHFALILLANTLYIATGMHAHESGALAIALMLGVVVCSAIAANYLYRAIEVPALKLKI